MYVPPQFRQDDVEELRAFVASTRLATLVTGGTEGLRASHVPMLYAPPERADAHGSLHFHLARANEQWRDLANGARAMAIFLGPDAYVSPTFYEGHAGGAVVPTWDYIAVHAHGIARVIEDPGELHTLVSRLTDAFEAERTDAWSVDDAPQTYMEKQLRGIVGVELAIERFDAKWKMSQNRSVGDRQGIVAGLRESPFESERRTADIVAGSRRRASRSLNVAVIGAGPAGAVAAYALARDGANVSLFERSAWPREKACGDGLTPSSVALLDEIGIALPPRERFAQTLVTGPSGSGFRAAWPSGMPDGTTCERARFDALLVDAAIEAGAKFFDRTSVESIASGTLVVKGPDGHERSENFDAIALGEGGTGGLAARAGLPPFAMRLGAYRGYVATAVDLAPEYQVHYAGAFVPGYAWVFPVAPRRANVGAVLASRGDVRKLLASWLESETARRALGAVGPLEGGRGGVIAIGRARRCVDRLFAIGDAAGIADPLSAEGVSQAMRSSLLLRDALRASGGDVARAAALYERDLHAFDANNREALRMRKLFALMAGPMTALAAKRPRLARHVIATGYFPKRDASWFFGTFAALR